MAEVIKFTATKLAGSGKQGILKADSDGYYEIVIGGLNTFNSAGEYYTLEGAQILFEKSSVLMRRIANGCLKGECGHPKKQPGMTMDEYVNRILSIEETNVSHHFKEIWLDPNYGRKTGNTQNPNQVAIMAKVKPSGPKGPALAAALENPSENVCFSIRAMTKDYFQRGVNHRVLTQILTWDWVIEPGLSIANKYDTPSLESIDEAFITRTVLESVAKHAREDVMALESNRENVFEALEAFNRVYKKPVAPSLSKW